MDENYIQYLTNPDFISQEELSDYQREFSQAFGLNQYAIIYKLYRKSVDRTVTFYYCTAEGLASYLTLSQNGKYAPFVLSTIQTGVLENPEGLLNIFFQDKTKKQPKIWIRGFEPKYFPTRIHNNAIDSIGLFNNKVLDFNSKWDCGWSYQRQLTIERHCKGYVSDESLSELKNLSLKEEFKSKKHQFLFEYLGENLDRIKKKDYILVSKITKLNIVDTHCNILYWEDFTLRYDRWRERIISVKEQIRALSDVLNKNKIPTESVIHIIPFCLEDEGMLYYKSITALKNKTITYLPNIYDFIDLKKNIKANF